MEQSKTSSGFLPLVGAPRQANHRLSCTTFNPLGDFPLRKASSISSLLNSSKSKAAVA